MRRPLSLLLVCLTLAVGLVPVIAGQISHERFPPEEPSSDGGAAPVRVAVDAAVPIVRRSIQEASFDGTPDQGFRLAAELDRFAGGVPADPALPSAATTRALASEQFDYLGDLVSLVSQVPGQVQTVARNAARCGAWEANATLVERSDWARSAHPAMQRLAAIASGLGALAAQPPAGVETEQLAAAADTLATWTAENQVGTAGCLPPANAFFLEVLPEERWPGGSVLLQGGAPTWLEGSEISLTAGSLGVDRRVAVPGSGGFLERVEIPPGATLGNHTFTASTANLTAGANLSLAKVPTQLTVEPVGPARVGERIDLRFRVSSPVPSLVGPGPLRVQGFEQAESTLSNGTVVLSVSLPSGAPRAQLHAIYPGTSQVQRAETNLTLMVIGGGGPALEARAAPGLLGPSFSPEAGPFIPLVIPDVRPLWPDGLPAPVQPPEDAFFDVPLSALLAVLGVLGAGILFWLARRHDDGSSQGESPEGGTGSGWGGSAPGRSFTPFDPLRAGLLSGFASITCWLRAGGRIHPSETPREIADHLHQWGVFSEDVVHAFERARYDPLSTEGAEDVEGSAAREEDAGEQVSDERGAEPGGPASAALERLDMIWNSLREVLR